MLLLLLLLLLATSLLFLLVSLGKVVLLLRLGVPLASLQDKDSNQDHGQNGVASAEHLHGILPAENDLASDGAVVLDAREVFHVPDASGDGAHSLDDVARVDADANDVQDERRAVEQHVGLGRAEELHEKAEKAHEDDDVEDARDGGRRGVQELYVRLEKVVVRSLRRLRGPEQREVIGKLGKENAQEETDSCLRTQGKMSA